MGFAWLGFGLEARSSTALVFIRRLPAGLSVVISIPSSSPAHQLLRTLVENKDWLPPCLVLRGICTIVSESLMCPYLVTIVLVKA